jgi:hypothetical protein
MRDHLRSETGFSQNEILSVTRRTGWGLDFVSILVGESLADLMKGLMSTRLSWVQDSRIGTKLVARRGLAEVGGGELKGNTR